MAWAKRHTQLQILIDSPKVSQARSEAIQAASLIPQTDENAASAVASHEASLRLVSEDSQEEILGKKLDASLAVLWSTPSSSKDCNTNRQAAYASLKSVQNVALSESGRDLSSIICLESNREGTVELVRCRMDRKIYVLKSTTKGAAKRGYRSNAPVTERRLLSLARSRQQERGKTAFTPACIAAFQSPGSLHILLDYCPAGDLYHFLESAGEAPISNEARNKTGGLLAQSYVKRYAIDMVAAISWLHDQGYMHRDIKPGNWLFDKSGHLLLCDLASAAPFAWFDQVPSSGNLPERDESRISKTGQRRVLYRHCCLIGTADYIAPEIFWSADLMGRRKERRLQREETTVASFESQSIDAESIQEDDDDDDDDEPPPDGPGLYGPEADWWSLGVVLFEMVYKRLPFFSEKIAETMEMIKHHEHYFRLDSWVECSPLLKDLIQRLMTHSEKRIGYTSSNEVKKHPLFRGIDWEKPWEGQEAPFIPRLDTSYHLSNLDSPGGLSMLQEEPSVLHSPTARQDQGNSTHFSQMWAGHANDFPGFPNSVELSRAAAAAQLQAQAEEQGNMEEEEEEEGDSSEATITNSSPSTRHALERAKSRVVLEAEKLWATYDPTWIGFSYVPDRDAFDSAVELNYKSQVNCPSPISSPDNLSNHNVLLSPQSAFTNIPMVSTPCQSRDEEERQPYVAPLHLQSTPFHPSVAHNLHRRAIETASRVRSETVDQDVRHSFATPMRKTSTPNLSSHNDRQQMMANLKTPANSTSFRAAIPASPYPFPLATVSRPKKTPGASRLPSSGLRRADLDRARSASVETGEGSDSRCSGGSNVKRDISEREAWKELQKAVMQSARKSRKDFAKEVWEEKKRENPVEGIMSRKRPPLIHAATEGVVKADDIVQPRNGTRFTEGSKRASAFGLGSIGDALKSRRPNLPRFLSHQSNSSKPAPLKPVVSMTSPERPASIISSSSTTSSPPQDQGIASVKSRLVLPGFWNRHGDAARLHKKKSARQLLLKAQDRETPTKIASRSGSPLLTSFQNISLGDAGEVSNRQENVSPYSKAGRQPTQKGQGESLATNSLTKSSLDSDDSIASLQTGHVSSSDVDRRPSSPPRSAMIAQLKKEESTASFRMRRRDSREMLSQYRQGINPDETMEEMEIVKPQSRVNLAVRRGPKRVMSIQFLQPANSNRSIGGISPGEGTCSLSSPSLPSLPDAFGGSFERKASFQDLRRVSVIPLQKVEKDRGEVLRGGGAAAAAAATTTTTTTTTITTQFRSMRSQDKAQTNSTTSRLTLLEARAGRETSLLNRWQEGKENKEVGRGNGRGATSDEVSMLSGLDWRYTSMQVNLSQVEERLERIKARLREN